MDNTKRFSNRVDNYVKYRPGYPQALLDYLVEELGINRGSVLADVGAGTGIFTRLLLERGNVVYAVEPNKEMREAAEAQLEGDNHFISINGSAEQTTLKDASVDAILSAQAFHWFDPEPTSKEFRRILKPGGMTALIWNKRDVGRNEFATAYDQLMKRIAPDYENVKHMRLGDADYRAFFGRGSYSKASFDNEQHLTYEELLGRASSSSYTPLPGTEAYQTFVQELKALFAAHQKDGYIPFHYVTEVYYGHM
ncbi:class I SAM-dependent methyltransferase [Paenibacillus mendelii]|uniref:Class I SAM-dependent methyltransferase n=1 Tax=Paenibacillus mendelii TaxID=206163 RepID=A0ABV6JAX3_9BACL|nr:class I SAM-dependent methyltransferase [Paenibacillus mendelii]MCQ6562915.1 class I SAM-dependent methyltransferase [Paenibacillus mendelii]